MMLDKNNAWFIDNIWITCPVCKQNFIVSDYSYVPNHWVFGEYFDYCLGSEKPIDKITYTETYVDESTGIWHE